MSADSHLRDTLSSVLDPGSQSCSLLAGHNQETNKKHIHEYVTIMYFPILIRIHGKKSAVAVDIQENRYMQYKCHCLLFPAGQTSF